MSFSSFCILNENIKVSETVEGIFALAIGAYIAHGKIDNNIINSLRALPEFHNGKNKTIIQANISDNENLKGIVASPGDKMTVIVEINPNPKSLGEVFSDDLESNSNIDILISSIVKKITNLETIQKIQCFVIDILSNNKHDDIDFVVNISNGWKIRNEVRLTIHAISKESQETKDTISFQLRAGNDAQTVCNLSIFDGILKLGRQYNLDFVSGIDKEFILTGKYEDTQKIIYDHPDKWSDENHFISYLRKYLTIQDSFLNKKEDDYEGGISERRIQQMTEELNHLRLLLGKFIAAFVSDLKGKDSDVFTTDSHARLFASRSFDFIQSEIFTSEMSEYIHISHNDIKEIKQSDIENMKYEYVVKVEIDTKGVMDFIGINIDGSRRLIFKITPRIEYNIKTNRKIQILTVDVGDI